MHAGSKFEPNHSRRVCDVCASFGAFVIVRDDPLADEDPMLYCEPCFHMLHYTSDGKLRETTTKTEDLPGTELSTFLIPTTAPEDSAEPTDL